MQLDDHSLDIIFREAHTHSNWLDKPVSDELLHQIYDLMKWAPTSANSCPGRFVFVRSAAAKQRLLPAMAPGNVEKTRAAPVTVIVGYDLEFYEKLPKLYPPADARSWYVGNQPLIDKTAFRNGTLQGAYLLIAARALGLDAGPMSGFDNEKVDKEFFSGTRIKSNFVINLGYGDSSKLFPRNPRLPFEEAAQIL
ncbi:MAG TPA: malonic semialdehyde reductase [Gallionella sp.]|nr:malonic semialdehyde reductase [Gallionella sp.]